MERRAFIKTIAAGRARVLSRYSRDLNSPGRELHSQFALSPDMSDARFGRSAGAMLNGNPGKRAQRRWSFMTWKLTRGSKTT